MAYVTNAYSYLKEALLSLEPGTQWGGDFANKPGYHNMRQNLPSSDYSVCDRPPDGGGPSDVAAAIDWTFPDAQRGDYSTIAKYTKRLFTSARDPNDPRLNGYREFYGQADDDSYVEGYDIRYQVDATSDSSHLWHIHISENRDQTTSYDNKDKLLSVLRGESLEDWDMPTADEVAKAVWNYNIASTGSYSGKGSQWVTLNRAGYLANTFAPEVLAAIDSLQARMVSTTEAFDAFGYVLDEIRARLCALEEQIGG